MPANSDQNLASGTIDTLTGADEVGQGKAAYSGIIEKDGPMKMIFGLVVLSLVSLQTMAQQTNSQPVHVQRLLQYQLPTRVIPFEPVLTPAKPNEIFGTRFGFSGIFVQVAKTRNPLQLINPFAPPQYGSGNDNVVWNVITGAPSGLKLFSISF
jgi:hypothetical protein